MQAGDIRASFLFVSDLNAIIRCGWVLHRHGVAAFDFSTLSGCYQFVVGPTHARGKTLDFLMTVVPDLVRVAVVVQQVTQITPLCRQSFRWLRLYQTCVLVEKFSLNMKSIGIQFVVQHRICPGVSFGLLTILFSF